MGQKFLYGFPVLVAVLCLATIFNVYSKIGAMCCIKSLRYRPTDDEKLIGEGERILQEGNVGKGKGDTCSQMLLQSERTRKAREPYSSPLSKVFDHTSKRKSTKWPRKTKKITKRILMQLKIRYVLNTR